MITFTRCAFMAKQACATFSQVVQKIIPPIANNFLKFFFALFAMLALGVGNAWGADVTETITYSDHKGKGTATTGSEYTMNGDKFSIKDSKFYCNTEKTFAQFMANSTITVTPSTGATIKSIVITASSSSYNGFQSSGTFNPSTGSVKKTDNTHITWTGSATSAFTISHTKQIRWTTIEVTYEETTSSGDTPDPTQTKLTAPTGLTVDAITSSGATLLWDAVANASSYVVTIVDGGSLKKDYSVTGTTTTVSGLSPSTDYLWTVKAIGDGTNYEDSEESEIGEFATSALDPEPGTGDEEGEYVWKLVENVSELHNLDEVIITASGEINYALSTEQKSTNRGATPITKEGKLLKDPSTEVQIITLVETESANVFGFNTGSGHLYAASSSANQLKTKTSLDEHGKWTITISEGVASIVATASTNRNVMQYNPNNSGSPLFACYSSASQTSLAIYKKVTSTDEPETPTPDEEEYISGKWKLVDATSKLQAGMEIIIASVAEEGAIKTMAEQRDNNRGAVASVLDGENLKPAVGTTLITLEDCQLYEGLFALKTKDGYLYAASSSSNQLKSRDAINDHACWEIAITNGVASAKATESSYRNVLLYNPNNGAPLFSCYASATQKPITIYSKVYDVTATAKNGSVSGTGTYYQGNSVTLKAIADTGYEFVNWTTKGDEVVSTDNPYTFTATEDVTLVANFKLKTYTVTVTAENGTLEGLATDGKYEHGATVTLKAIANTGYEFVNWTKGGEEVSTDETYTFKAIADVTLVANFKLKTYTVTVTAENGTLEGLATDGKYEHGATVTLKAIANTGYEFVNWTKGDEEVSTNATYTFIATEDITLAANFAPVVILPTLVTPSVESGIFSVGNGKYVQFSTGNLQYEVGTNTWSFASEQYEVIGGDPYTGSNNTNYGMNVPGYTGKLDLFAWSSDGKFGVNPSNTDDDYGYDASNFVDWSELVDDEEGWYTLTKDEMNNILARTKNGKKLWALATINDLVGLILLPDNWDTNINLVYGYIPEKFVYTKNLLSIAEWQTLEEAGAVFLPAGGSRTGGYGNTDKAGGKSTIDANGHYFHVDNVNIYGYYWLNTQDPRDTHKNCASFLILPGWDEGPTVDEEGLDDLSTRPQVWSREKRRGNSVRLVKEVKPDYTREGQGAGVYGTVCYPENIVWCDGAILYEVAGKEGNKVIFDEVTTPEAGMPYIFIADQETLNFFCGSETASGAGKHNSLQGTFETIQPAEDNILVGNYMLVNNIIKKCGINCGLYANRAYFVATDLESMGTAPAAAPGRRRISLDVTSENTTTSLDNITNGENTTIKVIENGQLIIIRNCDKFNAQGQKL